MYIHIDIYIYIARYRPATLDSQRPCGQKNSTVAKTVYSSDFFQRRNHSTNSQQLNTGLNSFLETVKQYYGKTYRTRCQTLYRYSVLVKSGC